MAGGAAADVVIEGVNGEISRAIRANLTLPEGCDQAPWQVRYRFRTSQQEIDATLQTFGYYSAVITRKLTFSDKCWRAEFHVDPGPPALIRDAHIAVEGEGAGFPEFNDVLETTVLRKGARFDHEAYEGLKTGIQDVATRFGFLDGHFSSHEVKVDAVANVVDIDLVFATGPRFRFGKTIFDSAALNEELLWRYVPYEEGDPFDAQQLGNMYESMLNSGYFDDVIIDTGEVHDSEVTVKVKLVFGRASRTRIGIGYSTDLGPSVFVGRNTRLVNHRGHQLNLDLSVSPVQSKVGGYYRIPRMEDEDSWISLYGGFLRERTDTSETSKTTVGVRHVLPLRSGWVETRFFEIVNYKFDVGSTERSNLSLVPGVNFSHTSTDSISARPRKAHRLDLEVSGTSTAIGSTVDYVSASAAGKWIKGLSEKTRFIGRTRIAAVFNDDFDGLPPGVRFFSGGDDRVRGFDFEEIGVVDAAGNVIGGDRLIEVSAEFDYRLRKNWAVATFMDAGSVSLSSFSTDFERSAGIGVRWYSPIGPLRIDLAKPLDRTGRGVRLHISLGPDL